MFLDKGDGIWYWTVDVASLSWLFFKTSLLTLNNIAAKSDCTSLTAQCYNTDPVSTQSE